MRIHHLLMMLAVLGLWLGDRPAAAKSGEPAIQSEVLYWVQTVDGCAPDPGPVMTQTSVHCGAYGSFILSAGAPPSLGRCPIVRSGDEQPPIYSATDSPPAQADPDLVPCFDGGCFGRDKKDWVAVVDWDDPHGWSVGETIHQLSDGLVDVVLFSFEEQTTRLPIGFADASDAHVLAALCAVAEATADNPSDPPTMVNLSFGRLAVEPNSPSDCVAVDDETFACQVERVLEHLADDLGLAIVGAAGNHRELLFPASSADVLAVGSLNLDDFGLFGFASPGWTTPTDVTSLMPGHGIYLKSPSVSHPYWTLPAGSSYAAAVASGWIAGALAASPADALPVPFAQMAWVPGLDRSGLVLLADGVPVAGSDLDEVQAVTDRALGSTPSACVNEPFQEAESVVVAQVLDGGLAVGSLAWLEAHLSHPLPGVRPCLPCHGGGGGSGGGSGGFLPTDRLVVDLSEGSPAPPDSWVLTGVFLQVGADLHALDRSFDLEFLAALTNGSVTTIEIEGVWESYDPGDEILLVTTLSVGDVEVWDATPILLHNH